MNILISALSYPTQKNPIAAFIAVLAEEMTCQGIDVTVIAPQSLLTSLKHHIPLVPREYKVKVKTNNGNKELTVMRPWSITFGKGRFYKLSQRIDRFVVSRTVKKLKNRPDIVYSHFWLAANNIIDYALKNNIPSFVATGEDQIDIDRVLDSKRIQLIRQNTRGVICVSTKNREESVAHHLTDGHNTIVLPNSINTAEFYQIDKDTVRKKLGFENDTFIVAFCGRFVQRKGCQRLDKALETLNNPHIKAIFIGYPDGAHYEDPQYDGIIFKGRLPHHEIVNYLNASDVFVLPTMAEGCSNAIVEAMACGLPVISSDMPFNTDIIDSSNAILIDPMDIQQIADAIDYIYKEPRIQKEMSMESLRKAENLTIEKRVSNILQFIQANLANNRKLALP